MSQKKYSAFFHKKKYFSQEEVFFTTRSNFLRLFIWLELGTFHDEEPRQNVYKYLRKLKSY